MRVVGPLVRRDGGGVVAESVEIADGFWSRLLGLQFRRALPTGRALLLVPCSSVHTCCLRFSLDLVMLDRDGVVREVRRAVAPWRFVKPSGKPHAILELPAGAAPVEPGQRLGFADEAGLPKSLQFLSFR